VFLCYARASDSTISGWASAMHEVHSMIGRLLLTSYFVLSYFFLLLVFALHSLFAMGSGIWILPRCFTCNLSTIVS